MKKRVECECGWVLETDDEDKLVAGVQAARLGGPPHGRCDPRAGAAQAKPV